MARYKESTPYTERFFTKTLPHLRTMRGWSQSELARRSGLSGGMISLVESGNRNLGLDNLEKLADAFGTTVGQMLGPDPAVTGWCNFDANKILGPPDLYQILTTIVAVKATLSRNPDSPLDVRVQGMPTYPNVIHLDSFDAKQLIHQYQHLGVERWRDLQSKPVQAYYQFTTLIGLRAPLTTEKTK